MTVENALGFLTDTVSFRCSVVVGEYMKKAWIGSLLFPFFFFFPAPDIILYLLLSMRLICI